MIRRAHPVPRQVVGLIGLLAVVLLVVGALRLDSLPFVGPGNVLRAEFAEAGGLAAGNSVVLSGARVGRVSDVALDGDKVVVSFDVDQDLDLGSRTEARIVTVTLLGEAALELVPAGGGELDPSQPIPVTRTSSPYELTSALGDLTTRTNAIDVDKLAKSVDRVSDTFQETPEELGLALDGLARLSRALGDNDELLADVLTRANRVSRVLAGRNSDVAALLGSGDQLLRELNGRRELVEDLLADATSLSDSIRDVVGENDRHVGPALSELDRLIRTLNRNKRDLRAALDGVRNYAIGFGEAVSSGPFFDAYVQNLASPASVAPVISGVIP